MNRMNRIRQGALSSARRDQAAKTPALFFHPTLGPLGTARPAGTTRCMLTARGLPLFLSQRERVGVRENI